MALDRVAANQSGVTGRRIIRDAHVEPTTPPVGVVFELYFHPAFCQVPDPARAAASTWVAPDLNPYSVEPRLPINGHVIGDAR